MKKTLFSRRPQTHRWFYLVLLLISVGALAFAWYLQNVKDLAPCPLCIAQRFGFWALGLFALLGLLVGRIGRVGNGLAVLSGLAATAAAGYHNWLLAQPKAECGIDPVQNFVNDLPTATWWPDMFMATGLCGAKLPLFLGLGIPQWSLLLLVVLTLGFVWRLKKV
ncbi:MAG: disulfide bond formation protein B [Formosimonas sp.]